MKRKMKIYRKAPSLGGRRAAGPQQIAVRLKSKGSLWNSLGS